MMWHDQRAYAEIITESFKTNEIEHLEDFTEHYIRIVEAGREVVLPDRLVLDIVADLDDEGRGTE